ncbi:MAG: peptide deformylase [Candidatus Saccharibacteria bacterium]|nr:peptide deformylase [Candidatus Saccharibacteria bacterium]
MMNGKNSTKKITQFGNSILRDRSKVLSDEQILSKQTRQLIKHMRSLLLEKKLGIGLAAPQVGVSIAVAVIELQKTPVRLEIEDLSLVIINPKITKVFGSKSQMWEGCISSGAGKAGLFAKVPRYRKIELEYSDEKAIKHVEVFEGLAAHVIQHEVDHLNGILFVDKVKDTSSFMTYSEYRKMKKKEK